MLSLWACVSVFVCVRIYFSFLFFTYGHKYLFTTETWKYKIHDEFFLFNMHPLLYIFRSASAVSAWVCVCVSAYTVLYIIFIGYFFLVKANSYLKIKKKKIVNKKKSKKKLHRKIVEFKAYIRYMIRRFLFVICLSFKKTIFFASFSSYIKPCILVRYTRSVCAHTRSFIWHLF